MLKFYCFFRDLDLNDFCLSQCRLSYIDCTEECGSSSCQNLCLSNFQGTFLKQGLFIGFPIWRMQWLLPLRSWLSRRLQKLRQSTLCRKISSWSSNYGHTRVSKQKLQYFWWWQINKSRIFLFCSFWWLCKMVSKCNFEWPIIHFWRRFWQKKGKTTKNSEGENRLRLLNWRDVSSKSFI